MSMAAESPTADTTLDALLQGIADAPPVVICGVSDDSRLLAQGDVFLACAGDSEQELPLASNEVLR